MQNETNGEKPLDGEVLDLDAIERRVAAATPGPWWTGRHIPGAVFVADDSGSPRHILSISPGTIGTVADAAFTAHARQDLPALLEEVRRLRAALQDVAAVRNKFVGGPNDYRDTLAIVQQIARDAIGRSAPVVSGDLSSKPSTVEVSRV